MNVLSEDKDLTQFKQIPIDEISNYLISKNGIIYNTNNQRYLKPYCHKNTKNYTIQLYGSHYQLTHLLYITFIDNSFDINKLRDVKSKYMINIKNTDDNLPYINFTIDDLELITKSEKLKLQKRNNRIINKYNSNKEFIKSYDNIEDIRSELNIKYNKYITLACGKNKNKLYNNYYFRYSDDDEIKNPYLIKTKDNNANLTELNEINTNINNLNISGDNETKEPEIWKQLSHSEYNEYYKNYEISNYGNYRNFNTQKVLKPHSSGAYYYANINIYNNEINLKQVKKERINVLVGKYFLDIPERYKNENIEDLVIDHIDGNKHNNFYKNLQYLSIAENIMKG